MRCSAHTMGLSDSLGSFIAGVRPWTSRRVPPLHRWWANPGPPGSRARCFRACTGSATARDPDTSRDIDAPRWCLPLSLRRRRPGPCFFRGSIPSPHVPLSTLRGCPCGQPHMTRGRCGSLSLHRVTLAFTTPRRFIPALSGIAPEATYQFKHALIRDAAYEALLKSRRKELHQLVAKTIDSRFPAIKETHPELLARHWTEAGETELAIAQWSKAGNAAESRNAFLEAQESYQRALALLNLLPESPERDLRELQLRHSLRIILQMTRGWARPKRWK